MRKKRKSKFLPIISILAVVALLLLLFDVFIYRKYYSNGKYKQLFQSTKNVDMTNPDGNTDYGRIYYSPVEEEHIVTDNKESTIGYIDNEVLVVANEGVTHNQIAELAASYNAEIVGEIEVSGDYQLRLKTAPDELVHIIENISAEPIIDSVSQNYVYGISTDSGDVGYFYYGKEWAHELRSDTNDDVNDRSWGFRLINTPKAWLALNENMSVIEPVNVGVCDAGMSDIHSDVRFEEFFYENDVYRKTTKWTTKDEALSRGHGTHVSGTFAADTYDDNGICGIYPYGNGRLYGANVDKAVETIHRFGDYDFYSSSMGEKVTFAELIVRNVKVINFSMGYNYGPNLFTDRSTEEVDYNGLSEFFSDESNHVKTAQAASILGDFYNRMLKNGYDFVLVASAGNDSSDETGHLESKYNSPLCLIERSEYPDVYDRIIVVGALDRNQDILECSNAGNRVDIFAPGDFIYSAYILSGYNSLSGTSMAAPHVSGVAAMVWTANKSLTGAQVKDIVINNPNTELSVKTVDAYNSVAEALKMAGTSVNIDLKNGAVIGEVIANQLILKPIEGAEVKLKNRSTGYSFSGTTDKDGFYEIAVPNGQYDMTVSADGYKDYKTSEKLPVSVESNKIVYIDGIKLKKDKGKSSKGNEGTTEPTTTGKLITVREKPKAKKIYTGEDINKYLPEKFGDFDKELFDKVKAWTYYDGHYYAIFDHAVSSTFMSIVTKQNSNVHLVTISSKDEQQLVEELLVYGTRDAYYTGLIVKKNGTTTTITGEANEYTHWYEGCPENYDKDALTDVVLIWRGSGDDPKSAEDFGYWFDITENEWSFFDFTDTETSEVSRGIIIEWDTPIAKED